MRGELDPVLPSRELWPSIIRLMVMDPGACSTRKKRDQRVRSTFGLKQGDVALLFTNRSFLSAWKEEADVRSGSVAHVPIAAKVSRLEQMQELLERVPDERVDLKLKILRLAREETEDQQPAQHVHMHGHINSPPPAADYEEWQRQNRQMEG